MELSHENEYFCRSFGHEKVSSTKETVRDAEYLGCLECISGCFAPDCLILSLPGRKKIAFFWLPLGIIAVFASFYLAAKFSGHWDSVIPVELFKKCISWRSDHNSQLWFLIFLGEKILDIC